MVNQSVIDSSVDLEQLKDIEDLIPDMDKAISEKVETFLDKSGDQPYAHMNEGYVVVVEMTEKWMPQMPLVIILEKERS